MMETFRRQAGCVGQGPCAPGGELSLPAEPDHGLEVCFQASASGAVRSLGSAQ